MRREFWITKSKSDSIELAYSSKEYAENSTKELMAGWDFIHVREVLPGEDDIVKMLVEALELCAGAKNEFHECFAKGAIVKYQAWKGKG